MRASLTRRLPVNVGCTFLPSRFRRTPSRCFVYVRVGGDWVCSQMEAITVVRRVVVFHRALLLPQTSSILRLIMHSADSLRSSVSKNAILCLQDLLNFMPKQLETERGLRGRPFRWFKSRLVQRQVDLSSSRQGSWLHPPRPMPCKQMAAPAERQSQQLVVALPGFARSLCHRLGCTESFRRIDLRSE